MVPPRNLVNLSAALAEIKDSEGGIALSADGKLLASDKSIPLQNIDWAEGFLDLMRSMTSVLDETNLGGLESGLLEGSKRKLVIHRNSKLGFFVIIVGRETMDDNQAGQAAANISLELESALGRAR